MPDLLLGYLHILRWKHHSYGSSVAVIPGIPHFPAPLPTAPLPAPVAAALPLPALQHDQVKREIIPPALLIDSKLMFNAHLLQNMLLKTASKCAVFLLFLSQEQQNQGSRLLVDINYLFLMN